MSDTIELTPDTASPADAYRRDGFVFPMDVISEAEAIPIRADFEAAEAELADDPEDPIHLAHLKKYMHN